MGRQGGKQETLVIIQASDDGSWDQAGFGGRAEKWLDSEFMSKCELTGFANELHVRRGKSSPG